jgi:hypothetical protein
METTYNMQYITLFIPNATRKMETTYNMQYILGILLKMQLNPHQKTQTIAFHNAKKLIKNN